MGSTPLTFTENSYWWLWIPLIGWIPFAIPLVVPLGPVMVGFSFSNKMRFVWESANHNGDTLPDGVNSFIGGFYTLGYNTVWRTYKAAKKMLAEEGRGDEPINGYTPLFLPFYILCPALVYMPLIRAMREHWQWHLRQSQNPHQDREKIKTTHLKAPNVFSNNQTATDMDQSSSAAKTSNKLLCYQCSHFEEKFKVCSYFHFNVESSPKKFYKKCDGKYFIPRG